MHRDLKPENLLLDSRGNVKVADFGFSNINFKDQLMMTFCGSPYYAPPEMNRGVSYLGPAADAWSLGVILYACLTGTLPFSGPDINTLYRTIRKGVYFVPDYLEPSTPHRRETFESSDACGLTRCLLVCPSFIAHRSRRGGPVEQASAPSAARAD